VGPRGAARRWVGLDVFLFGLNAQKKLNKEKNGGGGKLTFKKNNASHKKKQLVQLHPLGRPLLRRARPLGQ